ncbi:DNA invertase Pin-like site-specific DNA recombinase [Arthrobacter stackebrandtii]|uniref:DNA invertase Pin-like site-specific DNA recombinase n=1 Tax=Arthrobacter stackebrandtii TaxID=272161 RepID=A0ABS4Z104_9MICC|nr:recombinase family protein [Arthrobacter stackebrandtii]MBP2414723.1 DNA invertase Pin-like site-specific DNA recombinase [Arthrobacter stackebrandtii]PYH01807.1 recombinase [Arthrobacter stackebrandtii]
MAGYARVSTEEQGINAQRDASASLGVDPQRVYVDDGLTGRNKNCLGLRESPAACLAGDNFVATKPDRLVRSVRNAREMAGDPASREIKLSMGGSDHDPTHHLRKLLFNVRAMIAEFEADLTSMPTREGMKAAKADSWLRGEQPKLSVKKEAHLLELHDAGKYTMTETAEPFSISRSTIYRAVDRGLHRAAAPLRD